MNYTAQCLQQSEIAALMHCGVQNIKNLKRSAWDKLGAIGRNDGLVKATQLGLIKLCFTVFAVLLSALQLGDDEYRVRNHRRPAASRTVRTRRDEPMSDLNLVDVNTGNNLHLSANDCVYQIKNSANDSVLEIKNAELGGGISAAKAA